MENEPITVILNNSGITSVKIPIKEYADNRSTGEYAYYDKKDGNFVLNESTAKGTADGEKKFDEKGMVEYLKGIMDIDHAKASDAKLVTFVDQDGKKTSLGYEKGMARLTELELKAHAKELAFNVDTLYSEPARQDNTYVSVPDTGRGR